MQRFRSGLLGLVVLGLFPGSFALLGNADVHLDSKELDVVRPRQFEKGGVSLPLELLDPFPGLLDLLLGVPVLRFAEDLSEGVEELFKSGDTSAALLLELIHGSAERAVAVFGHFSLPVESPSDGCHLVLLLYYKDLHVSNHLFILPISFKSASKVCSIFSSLIFCSSFRLFSFSSSCSSSFSSTSSSFSCSSISC